MSSFVQQPHLPHRVDILLLGEKYADILERPLKEQGITPILVPDNPDVDQRLSGHADLSVFHAGGEKLFLAPFSENTEFHKKITEIGVKSLFIQNKQGKKYPNDAQLNACTIGDGLFYAPLITAKQIVKHFTNNRGDKLISVRQGYIKCSVCVVDERSIITADNGIIKVARGRGMDVLPISPGYIDLPGFDYGFIGGASFKLSDKLLAFTGRLDRHPDKDAILRFISEKGCEPIFLTERKLFDIGSAIPLTEKEKN